MISIADVPLYVRIIVPIYNYCDFLVLNEERDLSWILLSNFLPSIAS